MSRLFRRGLDRPRERWCLAACVVLCTSYLAVLAYLQWASVRMDDAFFARREEVLTGQLLQQRLPLGGPLPLTIGGRVSPQFVLSKGWSSQESWGVWTEAAHAEIVMALPELQPAMPTLELWAVIMQPRDREQEVSVIANGLKIGHWRFASEAAVFCVSLPTASVDKTGLLHLGIDVASPQRAPGGRDKRVLGFGLQRVELLANPGACEPDAKRPLE